MLVVTRDFNQQIGGTFLPFLAGKIIEDEDLEWELLRTGAPVVEVKNRADLISCPHCKKLFTVKQAVASEQVKKS